MDFGSNSAPPHALPDRTTPAPQTQCTPAKLDPLNLKTEPRFGFLAPTSAPLRLTQSHPTTASNPVYPTPTRSPLPKKYLPPNLFTKIKPRQFGFQSLALFPPPSRATRFPPPSVPTPMYSSHAMLFKCELKALCISLAESEPQRLDFGFWLHSHTTHESGVFGLWLCFSSLAWLAITNLFRVGIISYILSLRALEGLCQLRTQLRHSRPPRPTPASAPSNRLPINGLGTIP